MTNISGNPSVIKRGRTGLLVEPRNPEKLAFAIEQLLRNDELRFELAENAYRQVKTSANGKRLRGIFLDFTSASCGNPEPLREVIR